jgi:hypothetical protein
MMPSFPARRWWRYGPLLARPNHATLKMFGAAREPYSTASLARCFFRHFQTSLDPVERVG